MITSVFLVLVFRFLVYVIRHSGDVVGESGPQMAVEVLPNSIAIALK